MSANQKYFSIQKISFVVYSKNVLLSYLIIYIEKRGWKICLLPVTQKVLFPIQFVEHFLQTCDQTGGNKEYAKSMPLCRKIITKVIIHKLTVKKQEILTMR